MGPMSAAVRFLERLSPRIDQTARVEITLYASLALTGRITTLWEFYLYYALIGSLGLAATGHVMGSVMLARWFERHRGVAMSSLAGGYGAACAVAAALLLITAALSLAINETARSASRVVTLPGRPRPVAGGR